MLKNSIGDLKEIAINDCKECMIKAVDALTLPKGWYLMAENTVGKLLNVGRKNGKMD